MGKIKLAVAGLGNCASSLIQGFQYYRNARDGDVPGLMHANMGGYRLSDIQLVAAFDIDKRKVGQDVSKAVFSEPNCTTKFSEVAKTGVTVQKGPVLDGVAPTTKEKFLVDPGQKPVDVAKALQDAGAEVLVNYMPVGSEQATRYYAQACLDAGCGFVNCMPAFVVSDAEWGKRFEQKKIPAVGDDIKSQVGATILHRTLAKLFLDRGMPVQKTYQLNVGGNTDFLNMLERSRLKSKKISKTEAVQSQFPVRLPEDNIAIGPSDYVPWLKDKKIAFVRVQGKHFGDVPMHLECRLEVEDSPNSAGIVVDAVRACKIALDRETGGPILSASAYLMKHPPVQYTDEEARKQLEEFIAGARER